MNQKPILLQNHYLPRQAATAGSGKEGAGQWESLPPCSEARNQPFIPALRRRLRSLGHTCSDRGHADPRAPGAPLQEERLWPLREE